MGLWEARHFSLGSVSGLVLRGLEAFGFGCGLSGLKESSARYSGSPSWQPIPA